MDADLCPINRDISGHTIFVVDRSDAFSANLKSILVDKMYVEASRRVLLVELGARGGLEPSGAVAGAGGRHASRFSAG